MENGVVFTALSVVVTLLTSLFKTAGLSVKQKNLIATGLSVVAGAVTVWINSDGDFNGASVASVAVATYGASQLAYNFILKGTGLNTKLTTTNLFGTNSAKVEEIVSEVEKAVKKSAPKKATPAKKATTTTSKTTTK
jgi:hypothetical protein